jgi:DNA-binding NarL/FixJ family response regulator
MEYIQAGLRAGALGYALKDISAEQLSHTVRSAARGQMLLQADIASKICSALTPTIPETPASPPLNQSTPPHEHVPNNIPAISALQLTEREYEILQLVARGKANRQIAEHLYLTEGTVKNHMSNILSKLSVRDRTQAAIKARELGIM